jgi:Bifunctional DNA primase/polymerase, N-terminal
METLALASEYLQEGVNVIPLHPRSKKPLLTSWEPFKTTYATNEQAEEWFSNGYAGNNIAIVTGKISRVFALDIDGEEGNACFNRAVESLDDDVKTALKHSLCIRTGSGNTNIVIGLRQEEFASTGEKIANSVLWRSEKEDAKHDEIRLKGEGSYIVAPPSIHPNGNIYEIINGSIATITTLSKIQINKLISAIRDHSPQKNDSEVNLNEEDAYDIAAILKPYYQQGNRNDFTMYLSGWMRKEGIPLQSALKVIECIAADDEEKLLESELYRKHTKKNIWTGYQDMQDYS